MKKPTFQEIILKLQMYWSDNGCTILQPYDVEMSFRDHHPTAKHLKNVAYVQVCRNELPDSLRQGHNDNKYLFKLHIKEDKEEYLKLVTDSFKTLFNIDLDCFQEVYQINFDVYTVVGAPKVYSIITYNLKQIAFEIYKTGVIEDIPWSSQYWYTDINKKEDEQRKAAVKHIYIDILKRHKDDYLKQIEHLKSYGLLIPAHDYKLKYGKICGLLELIEGK